MYEEMLLYRGITNGKSLGLKIDPHATGPTSPTLPCYLYFFRLFVPQFCNFSVTKLLVNILFVNFENDETSINTQSKVSSKIHKGTWLHPSNDQKWSKSLLKILHKIFESFSSSSFSSLSQKLIIRWLIIVNISTELDSPYNIQFGVNL